MRCFSLAAVVAVLLSCPAPSSAAPFTDLLDGVKSEVDAQVALLQAAADPGDAKTLKTLLKVQAALDKPPVSVLGDLKAALVSAKSLDAKIPEDYAGRVALLAALDGAVAGFASLVEEKGDEGAALVAGITDPVLGAKLQTLLDSLETALTAAGAAPDAASRVRFLTKAWNKGLSVDANLARLLGKGGVGALVDGAVFSASKVDSSGAAFWVFNGPPLQYAVTGGQPLPGGGTARIYLDFTGADLRMDPAVYDFTVGGTNLIAAYREFNAASELVLDGVATAGSVTVHLYDPGPGVIRGEFEFEFTDPGSMTVVRVTRGTFTIKCLALKEPHF